MKKINDKEEKEIDNKRYNTSEMTRITRVDFDLEKIRENKVKYVEKSNVMEKGMFWKNKV